MLNHILLRMWQLKSVFSIPLQFFIIKQVFWIGTVLFCEQQSEFTVETLHLLCRKKCMQAKAYGSQTHKTPSESEQAISYKCISWVGWMGTCACIFLMQNQNREGFIKWKYWYLYMSVIRYCWNVYFQVYARMSEVLGITDDNHVLETFMTKMWVCASVPVCVYFVLSLMFT